MKHACCCAGATNAGSSKGPLMVPVLIQGSWMHWGPVGGQGLMRRVDFKEDLVAVWSCTVLGAETCTQVARTHSLLEKTKVIIPWGSLWDP